MGGQTASLVRHKISHNRLRANLKTETLDAELFIRYNFAPILDIPTANENTIILESENECGIWYVSEDEN